MIRVNTLNALHLEVSLQASVRFKKQSYDWGKQVTFLYCAWQKLFYIQAR